MQVEPFKRRLEKKSETSRLTKRVLGDVKLLKFAGELQRLEQFLRSLWGDVAIAYLQLPEGTPMAEDFTQSETTSFAQLILAQVEVLKKF